ncbi:LutC/YkgG family protein [Effusibacillus dendaii]|uniref:Lactate utilization protein C n=1 Tax=Effusibacillus dendaii TaxID=2743772 RepID=A0A7I8DC82_9BACL|nr:lactate utilization protein C [Effusibacillus dendaii]BCJ87627.1 lactate utilization protein C [Effusibacillus dendaii]
MSSNLTEQEFALLKRIAGRLGRSEPLTEKPSRDVIGPPDFWRQFQLSQEEKIERFCESWRALTGVAETVQSEWEAVDVLKRWIQEENITNLIRWDHPELESLGLDEPLRLSGITVNVWGHGDPQSMKEIANQAEAGITWADYAVADTGTLSLFSSREKARSVSLLPPIHIAVFRAKQLVTRIGEVMVKIDEMNRNGSLPAGVNFITGPSRSSDIENDLSIGVHGPKKVFALIIK